MPELSETVQHYLKCLYVEQLNHPDRLVPMGKLAQAMHVTPGTATSMVKSLDKAGLVNYRPRGGSQLTPDGRGKALMVIRKHRLIEAFLVQVMGMDWSEIHEEADRLEHAISDRLLARMDEMLHSPTHDPHGDPIPAADGSICHRDSQPVTTFSAGSQIQVARVLDDSPSFLKLLTRYHLAPGVQVRIIDVSEAADAVTLEHQDGCEVTLGTKAAAKLLASEVII